MILLLYILVDTSLPAASAAWSTVDNLGPASADKKEFFQTRRTTLVATSDL
jgi:hypothetical protein